MVMLEKYQSKIKNKNAKDKIYTCIKPILMDDTSAMISTQVVIEILNSRHIGDIIAKIFNTNILYSVKITNTDLKTTNYFTLDHGIEMETIWAYTQTKIFIALHTRS